VASPVSVAPEPETAPEAPQGPSAATMPMVPLLAPDAGNENEPATNGAHP